nr:hypothetical protein [Bacilli bacterium]
GSTGSTGSTGTSSPPLPTVLSVRTFGKIGGTQQINTGMTSIRLVVPNGAFLQPEKLTMTSGTVANVQKVVKGLSTQSIVSLIGLSFSGATPTKPITLSIQSKGIATDSVVYKLLTGGSLTPLHATIKDGVVMISVTSDPDFLVLNVKKGNRVITIPGHTTIVPAWVKRMDKHGNETTYMPIWYMMQIIKYFGIHSTWNGHDWNMSLGQPSIVTKKTERGSMDLYENGQFVHTVDGIYAKDPSTDQNTTYMPIWYVMQLLKKMAITTSWNGMTWTLTNNSKQ